MTTTQIAVIAILLVLGFLMGQLLQPRTVGWLGVGLVGLCVLGVLVGAAFNSETVTYASGIAGMAAPFVAVLVYFASRLGAAFKRRRERSRA